MKILSNSLSESEIYLKSKTILLENNWIILGGEPPGGTDTIPRIELRDPTYKGKGSKGSKKIDLIAIKEDKLLLIELKSKFAQSDIEKLNLIVSERKWRESLNIALKSKRAFKNNKISKIPDFINNTDCLIKTLGLPYFHSIPNDYLLIIIKETSFELRIGLNCITTIRFFLS